MMRYLSIPLLAATMLLAGCGASEITEQQEYYRWLNNGDNGLLQEKYANGFRLAVKHLPAEYLVYRELEGKDYNQSDVDELMKSYANTLTFMFTVAPDERKAKGRDVVMYEVFDKQDYKVRVQDLNFHLDEYVELQAGDETLPTLLHTMENTYGLGKHRNFIMVFGKPEGEPSKLDFVFNDAVFDTGISHFVFDREALAQVPAIGFWNTKHTS